MGRSPPQPKVAVTHVGEKETCHRFVDLARNRTGGCRLIPVLGWNALRQPPDIPINQVGRIRWIQHAADRSCNLENELRVEATHVALQSAEDEFLKLHTGKTGPP